MKSVWILQHAYTRAGGTEEVKTIGAYSSREAALEAVTRLAGMPGFCDHPRVVDYEGEEEDGFHINEFTLDKDGWSEGFITWEEAMSALPESE